MLLLIASIFTMIGIFPGGPRGRDRRPQARNADVKFRSPHARCCSLARRTRGMEGAEIDGFMTGLAAASSPLSTYLASLMFNDTLTP